MKLQKAKMGNLTERMIRLETQLEMMTRAVEMKRIQN
jgi:hypothetical protein